MPEVGRVCMSLRDSVQGITERTMDQWRAMARQEPWAEMPSEVDHDHLPETIASLLDACSKPSLDDDALRRGVDNAAKHGEHRAQQGFDEGLIFREYRVLRNVLEDHLREVEPDPNVRARALIRLDAGITALSGASLRGLHKRALEADGKWTGLLDRYVDELDLPDV